MNKVLENCAKGKFKVDDVAYVTYQARSRVLQLIESMTHASLFKSVPFTIPPAIFEAVNQKVNLLPFPLESQPMHFTWACF